MDFHRNFPISCMEITSFSIGHTCSFMLDFPASHVIFWGGNLDDFGKNLKPSQPSKSCHLTKSRDFLGWCGK